MCNTCGCKGAETFEAKGYRNPYAFRKPKLVDTDKYKGHSEGHKNGSWDLYEMYGSNDKLQLEIRPLHDKWGITIPITSVGVKDAKLIADAPMLLEEVKDGNRIKEYIYQFAQYPSIKKIHLDDLIAFIEEDDERFEAEDNNPMDYAEQIDDGTLRLNQVDEGTDWVQQVVEELLGMGWKVAPAPFGFKKAATIRYLVKDGKSVSFLTTYFMGTYTQIRLGRQGKEFTGFDAEEFESEMKGSVEYERDKTTTKYDRERIMQDYVVEIDDEDIVPYSKNLENLERAKEEIKEDIKSEVESNPENYARQLSEIEAASSTKVEFEDGTTRDIYAYGELKSPQIVDTEDLDVDDVEYSESSGSYFAENLGAESTPFAEGRNAAKTMWMPDSTKEDYYSGVDTEYMITYDITPDELMQEIENNSSRYLQFFSGWDDGWNESSLVGLGVLQDPMQEDFDDDDVMMDYEFAGEYIGDEYVPSDKEVMAYGGVAVLLFSAVFGYKLTERLLKKSETFKAPETCTNDDDCPDGKVCVDGQCLPICEDDGDCASWQECRSDLHPTEKVCGEDLTYSTSNPFIPTPKPQENAEQPPEKTESRFSPKNLAIGGGVVAVALVGLTALRMKGRGDE